jgi:hypothetical protein
VPQGPGHFGINLGFQIGVHRIDNLLGLEMIESQEPVRLIEAVFAQ